MDKNSSISPEALQSAKCRVQSAKCKTLAALLVASAALILFFFNPQQHVFYPFCMFHRLTGLLCPGCGSLRAMHELLHAHFLAAVRFNPLLVASVPVLLIWGAKKLLRRANTAPAAQVSPAWIWSALGILLAFGIVRNLPFFRDSLAGF